LTGPQLFPTPGLRQSNYPTLAAAEAQVALGNGGNWLKFAGLTIPNLKIAETSTSYFNENGIAGLQVVNTAAPGNAYADWISGFPGVGTATGFAADPDHDGIGNGLENYLGTNPSQAGAGLASLTTAGTTFKFRHFRSNHPATDVTAVYEWSADLTNWRASGQANGQGVTATLVDTVVTDAQAPDNDVVEVTVTATAGSPARIFARIRATQT
jgi:hypothetical protein